MRFGERTNRYALLCILFFLSGFCGLLYQTVWLRLAFADFGVITPIISVVIAVFMLGLGLGSLWGGKYIVPLKQKYGFSAIAFYGVTELLIGIGAFAVPREFDLGRQLLLNSGSSDSYIYLVLAGLAITLSLLPWCIAMGATFPFVIEFLNEFEDESTRHFGLLYAANVAGALAGTLLTVYVFIELFGFHRVLGLAAAINFLIAAVSLAWGLLKGKVNFAPGAILIGELGAGRSNRLNLTILFLTGLCSMGMEVAWTRAFAQLLGSLVYSFAMLLAVYLFSTWFGSFMYRMSPWQKCLDRRDGVITFMAPAACLPLLANHPGVSMFACYLLFHSANAVFTQSAALALLSIAPFSVVLGYLTPLLVDQVSEGNPRLAGKAYAINICGCIIGPLIAGYLLIPHLGARLTIIILVLPLLVLAALPRLRVSRPAQAVLGLACLTLLIYASTFPSWEEGGGYQLLGAKNMVIHRDFAGTTLDFDHDGKKYLVVNGSSMTALTPICKYMSDLPCVLHYGAPRSILVICFGMGTTFRSACAWGANVTAVELVPGVKNSFSYFHPDAGLTLANPKARIVIDDGRRFLMRTKDKFDVVIVDPPPPAEAIGSSLLYSQEFYDLIKKHLKPGGILQEWYGHPFSEKLILQAATRSLVNSFAYVRAYKAIDDQDVFGYHFLASDWPIDQISPEQMMAKLPPKVIADLQEFSPRTDADRIMRAQINQLLSSQVAPAGFLNPNVSIVITDDRPYNEYFWVRRHFP